jgi:hypothetical protein
MINVELNLLYFNLFFIEFFIKKISSIKLKKQFFSINKNNLAHHLIFFY